MHNWRQVKRMTEMCQLPLSRLKGRRKRTIVHKCSRLEYTNAIGESAQLLSAEKSTAELFHQSSDSSARFC